MPRPVSSIAPAPGPDPRPAPAARPPSPAGELSFRDHLARAASELAASERTVDRAIAGAGRGAGLGPEQLLAFQATIYRHSLKVDIASKLVEKATSAVRQTLQSQT